MLVSIRAALSRIRAWLSPHQVEEEFGRELETHLAMLTQEHLDRGMAPEEAARAARIRLGGLTQLKETHREQRGLPLLETLLSDTRYAFRMLRKNPGFTTVVVLTLALGIGANTAIFSVVYAALLKPLPYPDSNRLFNVFQLKPQDGITGTAWSYPNFQDLRAQNHSFSEVAGVQHHQLTLTGHGLPAVVNTSAVTAEFFSVFEVPPLAGRIFSSDDGKRGAPAVAILSEGLWRNVFGADPHVIGSSIDLDKRSFTVVGVMPEGFRFPLMTETEQLWIPLVQDPLFGPWMENRQGHWLQVTGRLQPGVSNAQAQAELEAISRRLAADFPAENRGWQVSMLPLQQMVVWDVKPPLILLFSAVGLVLLIACANIANLLLARATSRVREIAVRATLGAARSRIIRQLLTETVVLGLIGGFAGLGLAYWGVEALRSLLPPSLAQVNTVQVDPAVLGFALGLSALASLVFGMAPAFLAANSDLHSNLREGGGRSGESRGNRRTRSVLAAAEIALAMALLVGAGLTLRSFARLTATNPGFEPEHLVKASVSLPRFQYSTPERWLAFSDELLRRLQAEPGMQDSALAVPMPIADHWVTLGFDIPGSPPLSADASRMADYVSVSPKYFQVMGVPLLAGRFFDAHDVLSAPRVTLISRAFATTYFPNENPIGKRVKFGFPPGSSGEVREIVGIVGDVRDVSLGQDPGPMLYVPFDQAPFWGAGVLVRSSLDGSSVAAALRRQVNVIDKDLPVTDVAAMPEVLHGSVAQPRFRTLLLALFAAMALVLAATGIFGVISYSVSRRTNEIGVRLALGASRAAILQMVLQETLGLTAAGLALGIPCALAASRLLGHMLFDVSASDPATLLGVAGCLTVVAVLAAYVPARRAMAVDPMISLRHE